MTLKVPKDTPHMERELKCLLGDLCVNWGFCIPPADFEAISKQQYYHADDFAVDVVESEGLSSDSKWVNEISRRFTDWFGNEEIDSETFTDPVRGIRD